jgi:HAD superfamily hydrolase (TIGR01484 family)
MTLPIKIIATDFDGTLYTDQESPGVPDGLQTLIGRLQAAGAKWVINTGRNLPSLLDTLQQARLSIQPDYLVVVEREIHCRYQFSFVSLASWNERCASVHDSLFRRIRDEIPRLRSWIHQRFRALIYEDEYSPFCLQAANNADTDQIMVYLEDFCAQVPGLTIVRNDVYARFGHADFNKGTALGEITRQLGLDRQVVFAAGDHFNDLPMLSNAFARCLVAPGNAIDSVKEAVRRQRGYVSRQPYGHGVARGLAHFLAAHCPAIDPSGPVSK